MKRHSGHTPTSEHQKEEFSALEAMKRGEIQIHGIPRRAEGVFS